MTDSPPAPAGRRPSRLYGPLLAFLITSGAFCAAWVARGTFPFGDTGRAVNDQANQYVPFHRALWDLVHGQAAGDLLFTWRGGFGQQFLSDYYTYLGNPFSWLAVLVPRAHVDLAVFALTPVTMGTAAALMTVYLGKLQPGPWWQRGVLGACYGLCGWALSDASYIPMWLWGLVALPLLGIAVEWCLEGRRWPGAALFVALAWYGNFYTAMMATMAACVLLGIRLATRDMTGPERLRALWRASTAAVTGVLLTLPLLLPSFLSSGAAQPTKAAAFDPVRLDVFLAGMLPATHLWGGRPRLYVASLGLILAGSFVFNTAIARKTRLVWAAATLLVAASFQFPPTQYLWHGLAVPNGNPYREAFVFSGMVVILAWLALANRPRPLHLALTAGLLLAATFALRHTDDFGGWTWPAVLGGGAVSLLALLLLSLAGKHRALVPVAAVLMVGVVFAESTAAAANADARRARERWAQPAVTSNQSITRHFEAVRGVDGWPAYRTDSGAPQTSYNDALALRAEGPQYYSSYLPQATYQALEPLGYGYKNDGRTFFGADNPVLDALFSIGARVRPGTAPNSWTTSRFPAPPLVTVRSQPFTSPNPAASVYARQENALGATVYQVPRVTRGGTATEQAYGARCTPGSEAYWYSPALYGTALSAGTRHRLEDRMTGVLKLGPVPASGRVDVTVRTKSRGHAPDHPIGCLDRTKLDAQIAHLTATGATSVRAGGHTIEATLPRGATGTAVFAMTDIPGWHCSAPLRGFHGLVAMDIPSDGGTLTCTFTPKGLTPGLAAATLALLALASATARSLATALRRRRRA
ncbi:MULTISPECIES: YfhO family protein [unclassified Streptomyces]|uniref:YfhO family protein n=1 Tax=unclassified Streptomyces TaxID=2593676 RepID=UPI001BE659A8|nr:MULTISPECIES: YfhO family protein [unclassified Streptomyces]MBT2402492.1 YfhO family protein [Streptomyces sp. ISL-21]MBT2610280.1 YfhO family protein [Streptomyces sp. ISL-87]